MTILRGIAKLGCGCLLANVAVLAGCGNSEGISTDFKKPASERADLDQQTAAAGPIKIPEATPFNFNSFRSGQSGVGQGSVQPVGKNGFSGKAEAKEGGNAWAEFHIGYTFDLTSPNPQSGIVRLRLKAASKQKIEHPAAPTSGPAADVSTAAAQLRFVVKDTNGRLLKDENLLAGDGEKGPRDIHQQHDIAFDIAFEPGLGYYLVIGGRCDVQTMSGDSASVTLEVSDAAIEITLKDNIAAKTAVSAGGTGNSGR